MKRRNSIITLLLTLSMVFSTSAFAVFADTIDQEEQIVKDTPATEEVVNETPEEPAAAPEQAAEVPEQGAEAVEPKGDLKPAEEPTAEIKDNGWINVGYDKIDNPAVDAHGDNWTYVGSTRTLTLTNFETENGIKFEWTDLNIVLQGNNTISGTPGIYGIGNLTVSGNGSLTINYDRGGIVVNSVVITGGTITMNGDYEGINARTVSIKGGTTTIKVTSNDEHAVGISANNVLFSGGTVNIDSAVHGVYCQNDNATDDRRISIQGGSVSVKAGYGAGLYADTIDLSGGSVRATGRGAVVGKKIAFSGDVHADFETVKPQGDAGMHVSYEYPAVLSWEKDGITLSDDLQIVLPENGKIAPYSGIEATSVTINALGDGTTIADASGKPAAHVIIEKVAKDRNPSGLLLSKAVAKGKTDMEISWTAMNDVDGYDVFFSRCNTKSKTYEPQLVASVKADTTSYTVPGLKKGTPYKAYVQAYITKQGAKQYVGASLLTHAFAGGSSKRFTNPKSVKVKKSNVSVKTGKKYKIRASVRKVKKSKKLIRVGHAPKLRYLSSNTSIATVSKKGKIKGVAPGTCTVYAIAANGVYKAVNVTVK